MKKKVYIFLSVIFAIALAVSITACDDNNNNGSPEPEHIHKEVTLDAVAATCTEAGLTEGKQCSECGKVTLEQHTIEALGHDKAQYQAKKVSCADIGWEAYEECSRCDYTTYEEIPALGHAAEEVLTDENYQLIYASTCIKYGRYKYRCAHIFDGEESHWVEVITSPGEKEPILLENMSDEQKALIEKQAHDKKHISAGEEKCSICKNIWSTYKYDCCHVDCKVYNEDGSSYCSYCGTMWGPPVTLG